MSELQYVPATGGFSTKVHRDVEPEAVCEGVCQRVEGATDAIRLPLQAVQIITSGISGVTPTGAIPVTFDGEARQAWRNVRKILLSAGASLGDIVSVRTWLTDPDDITAYTRVHKEFVAHEPACFLAVVHQLQRPELHVQLEVIASVQG